MPSSPPPDRFQREIDDIIRLAERRLERESFGYRWRRTTRRISGALGGTKFRLPAPEVLGGWAMALLLANMLLRFASGLAFARILEPWTLILGLVLLVAALVTSLMRGRGGSSSGGSKMWRGERISYGNPYGEGLLQRLRRLFRGR